VSLSSDGGQARSASGGAAISADGRFVAFASKGGSLVAGDTNFTYDVFVRDRQDDSTERVSVASDGTQTSSPSYAPAISGDGRFVAFSSPASNLVADDTNAAWDVFVHDRHTGTTERVSVTSGGAQVKWHSVYPSLSADGRFVAFDSDGGSHRPDVGPNLVPGDTNGTWDVFVHDRQTATIERVSVSSTGAQGNSVSMLPAISGDGRYVAYVSSATNLVAGDTNGAADVFVRDRHSRRTERVSVGLAGAEGHAASWYPTISADGRFVAFDSDATNLVAGDTNGVGHVFARDRTPTGDTTAPTVIVSPTFRSRARSRSTRTCPPATA
jgi:Tol biopolymer transport system component